MKLLLRTEEIIFFLDLPFHLASLCLVVVLLLLLTPDLGMPGYPAGDKTGARIYNLTHHSRLAAGFYLFGIFLSLPLLQLSGLIIFSHSAIDRGLGYGLKYYRGFGLTHLGEIRNNNG